MCVGLVELAVVVGDLAVEVHDVAHQIEEAGRLADRQIEIIPHCIRNCHLKARVVDAAGVAHTMKNELPLLRRLRRDARNHGLEFVVIGRLTQRLGQRLNRLRRIQWRERMNARMRLRVSLRTRPHLSGTQSLWAAVQASPSAAEAWMISQPCALWIQSWSSYGLNG